MSKDEGGYRATALRSDRGARGVIGQGVLSTVANYIRGEEGGWRCTVEAVIPSRRASGSQRTQHERKKKKKNKREWKKTMGT